MENICLSTPEQWGAYITAAVTVFSVVANFAKPDTTLGKVLHWLALNFTVNKKQ